VCKGVLYVLCTKSTLPALICQARVRPTLADVFTGEQEPDMIMLSAVRAMLLKMYQAAIAWSVMKRIDWHGAVMDVMGGRFVTVDTFTAERYSPHVMN